MAIGLQIAITLRLVFSILTLPCRNFQNFIPRLHAIVTDEIFLLDGIFADVPELGFFLLA
jgi:hypothetical protein